MSSTVRQFQRRRRAAIDSLFTEIGSVGPREIGHVQLLRLGWRGLNASGISKDSRQTTVPCTCPCVSEHVHVACIILVVGRGGGGAAHRSWLTSNDLRHGRNTLRMAIRTTAEVVVKYSRMKVTVNSSPPATWSSRGYPCSVAKGCVFFRRGGEYVIESRANLSPAITPRIIPRRRLDIARRGGAFSPRTYRTYQDDHAHDWPERFSPSRWPVAHEEVRGKSKD